MSAPSPVFGGCECRVLIVSVLRSHAMDFHLMSGARTAFLTILFNVKYFMSIL